MILNRAQTITESYQAVYVLMRYCKNTNVFHVSKNLTNRSPRTDVAITAVFITAIVLNFRVRSAMIPTKYAENMHTRVAIAIGYLKPKMTDCH